MPRPQPDGGRPSGRGGRRPGAGAPKGNLNALRTGARSKQLKGVIVALLAVPETRRVLLHFAKLEHNRRALLQGAINDYARLLDLPSRERTINAVRNNRVRKNRSSSASIRPESRSDA